MFLGRLSLLFQTHAIGVFGKLKIKCQSVSLVKHVNLLLKKKIRYFVCAMLRHCSTLTHARMHACKVILNNHQYGFREKHSTIKAKTACTYDIIKTLEEKVSV